MPSTFNLDHRANLLLKVMITYPDRICSDSFHNSGFYCTASMGDCSTCFYTDYCSEHDPDVYARVLQLHPELAI